MSKEFGALAPPLRVPIWPWPLKPEDLAALKEAKAALGVDTKIIPVPSTATEGGRIIAMRERPPWVAPYALVHDPSHAGAMLAALKWAIVPGVEDRRATDTVDILRSILGEGVKEVSKRQLASENISKNLKMDEWEIGKSRFSEGE